MTTELQKARLKFRFPPGDQGKPMRDAVSAAFYSLRATIGTAEHPEVMGSPWDWRLTANRVQHALRAFTPKDQKAVKAAAQTLRANPKLNVETAITELAVGEALVSFLDDKGRPNVVERAFVLPPASRIGPLSEAERDAAIKASPIYGQYEKLVDRESAYEKLKSRTAARQDATSAPAGGSAPAGQGGLMDTLGEVLMGKTGPRGGRHDGLIESMAKSTARTIGSQIGREVVRGVLGSILGGAKRRR